MPVVTVPVVTVPLVTLCMIGLPGHALKYASAALRADKDVVLLAVTQNDRALKHADASLWVSNPHSLSYHAP